MVDDMTKRFEELKAEASEAGLNDTVVDEVLSENALLWVDEVEDELSDELRDQLVQAYRDGFGSGL